MHTEMVKLGHLSANDFGPISDGLEGEEVFDLGIH